MSNLNLKYTKHCNIRCQQRGISSEVVDFIVEHGKFKNSHNDKKYYINKKILNKLKYKHKNFLKKFEKQILKTGVIINKNTVITAFNIQGNFIWN